MPLAKGGGSVVGLRIPGYPPILEAYLGTVQVWDGHVNQLKQVPTATATAVAPKPIPRGGGRWAPPTALGYAEAISAPTVRAGVTIAPPPATAVGTAPVPSTISDQFLVVDNTAGADVVAYPPEGGASAGALLFPEAAEGSAMAYPPELSTHANVTVPMAGPANVDVYAPTAAMVFIADPNTAAAAAAAPVPVVSGSSNVVVPVATAAAVDYPPEISAGSEPVPDTATATAAAPAPAVAAGEGDVTIVPVSTAAAVAPVPEVGGGALILPPVATATATGIDGHTVTATSDVAAETGTASGMGRVPVVRGDQIQVVGNAAAASAAGVSPAVSAGSSADVPASIGSSQAYPPAVAGSDTIVPSGTELIASHEQSANVWGAIPSAKQGIMAAYPGTVRDGTGTGFVVTGGGNARFTATVRTNSSTSNRGARLLINGTVVATQPLVNVNTLVVTWDNILVSNGDIAIMEVINNGSITSQRTFVAPTSLEMVPMP